MIRGLCRFALMLVGVFVTIELTLAVAAIGGWLRFVVALLIGAVALYVLDRALSAVAAVEEQQWRIAFEDIEPGSWEDLLNRADTGCELCEGRGRWSGAACPCTQVASS